MGQFCPINVIKIKDSKQFEFTPFSTHWAVSDWHEGAWWDRLVYRIVCAAKAPKHSVQLFCIMQLTLNLPICLTITKSRHIIFLNKTYPLVVVFMNLKSWISMLVFETSFKIKKAKNIYQSVSFGCPSVPQSIMHIIFAKACFSIRTDWDHMVFFIVQPPL